MSENIIREDRYIGKWVYPKNNSLNAYVGRNGNKHNFEIIETDIENKIKLKKEDVILDVCCGNALITSKMAKSCQFIYGVDYSDILINQAKEMAEKNGLKNISYTCADAISVKNIFRENFFDKIICYCALQHFDHKESGALIKNLLYVTKIGGHILIGDIPNKNKKINYKLANLKSLIKNGKALSFIGQKFHRILYGNKNSGKFGYWYNPKDLVEICTKFGVKATILKQKHNLPHSHYRFDLLIEK